MRRNKSNKKIIFVVVILILMLLAIFYAQFQKFKPNKQRLSIKEELNITDDSQYAICINGKYDIEYKAYDENGKLYLPIMWVKENINDRFYYNEDDEQILYSLPYKTKNFDYKTLNGEAYIDINDVATYTDISYLSSIENHIINFVTKDFADNTKLASAKKDSNLRQKGGIKSPIIFDILKDEKIFVIDNMQKWAKVVSLDGKIGYIKKNRIKIANKSSFDSTKQYMNFEKIKIDDFDNQVRDHKICMGWHLMMNKSGNSSLQKIFNESEGLNVISPTWFSIKDNAGNIESFADSSYVKLAHNLGLEVWGLVSDINYKAAKSHKFLHTEKSRRNIIESLINIAKDVKMDGINLDFESILKEKSDDYVQFVRELSIECRKNSLVFSIDNYVPRNFNKHYNRKEQGIFADYVVIMGYDEHYAGSNKAGSVASIDFVKNAINETLKEVPKQRVINALPAYMRVWTHTSEGLKARSISMHQARQLIEKYNLKPEFDDSLGQYYVQYDDENGNSCEIWFEDATSLDIKMNFMIKKDIAGLSLWRLGLETKDVWEILSKMTD